MSSRNAKIVSPGSNSLERGPLAEGKQGRHQWVALFPSLCLDNGMGLACGVMPDVGGWGGVELANEGEAAICSWHG